MLKDVDKKIILELLKDGRQSFFQIAHNVGTTRQTVSKKVERFLNSGLITSFASKLDAEKLGLSIQAYIFMREDPRSELRRKNEEIIKGFYQVSRFHRVFGKHDSVIEVIVKDKNELTDLVKNLHKLGSVRETETFIVHSTIKDRPEDPLKNALALSDK